MFMLVRIVEVSESRMALRNFYNICVRCSILILLIKLSVVAFVRCRIVRCSIPDCTSIKLKYICLSLIHKHFMYLRILSLWTWWDRNMHSIHGISCQEAWIWPVCRSEHVACNKTTKKSVVPDVPLFYFISTILAHRDVFRQIETCLLTAVQQKFTKKKKKNN